LKIQSQPHIFWLTVCLVSCRGCQLDENRVGDWYKVGVQVAEGIHMVISAGSIHGINHLAAYQKEVIMWTRWLKVITRQKPIRLLYQTALLSSSANASALWERRAQAFIAYVNCMQYTWDITYACKYVNRWYVARSLLVRQEVLSSKAHNERVWPPKAFMNTLAPKNTFSMLVGPTWPLLLFRPILPENMQQSRCISFTKESLSCISAKRHWHWLRV